MSTASTIPVKILVMDRHFLYLPLYIAQFDSKETNKLPFFGKIPSQYSVEVAKAPHDSQQTDQAVFDELMKSRLDSSDVMFAACDPTAFLAKPHKNALMIASLITSSAFWAVNHDAGDVRLLSDLSSFKTILCYGKGTTST